MRLHPVNKLNIKDVLRTPSYVAMLLIMIILPFNSLLQILRTNTGPMAFIPVYIYLVLNLSIYLFLNMIALSLIVISEKTSGRCEYYLANKVDIRQLTSLYSRSAFVLSIAPILLFNALVFAYALVSREALLLHLFQNVAFVMFAAAYLLFTYAATGTLTLFSMLSKSPERVRTFLSVSAVLFVFAASLPGTFLRKLGITPDGNAILWITGCMLLLLAALCTAVRSSLNGKLSNESIILSYKQ
ncbi:hypothetical protein NST99_23285 [Paenibacillus sp. FSL L8-0470]|uniref:hypothetical protein n=1 Tax=unclassified Paenibacillus TaxID=185978 RepID=UPI0030F690C7